MQHGNERRCSQAVVLLASNHLLRRLQQLDAAELGHLQPSGMFTPPALTSLFAAGRMLQGPGCSQLTCISGQVSERP